MACGLRRHIADDFPFFDEGPDVPRREAIPKRKL